MSALLFVLSVVCLLLVVVVELFHVYRLNRATDSLEIAQMNLTHALEQLEERKP